MDIVALALCALVYIFLLELSFGATTPHSQRFWAVLCMAMALAMTYQVVADGQITIGTSITVSLDTAIGLGLFFLILVPVMRIYDTRNP